MKRPLLIVAVSYIFGIIIGVYLKISIPFILLLLIILTLKIKEKKYIKIILLIFITIVISTSKTIYLNNKYNTLYKKLEEKEITLIGTVCSNVKETDYKYTVTFKVDNIKGEKNTKYKNTKLILNVKKDKSNKQIEKLKYGNKLMVNAVYNEPATQSNYKGFSYKDYLKTMKTYGVLSVDQEKYTKVIKEKNLNFVLLEINKLTLKLKDNLNKILNKEESTLAQSILLGDCLNLEENIKENFKNCNLSHMLAISGAHLSYLVLGLGFILNNKSVGKNRYYILTIIFILVFMIMTNMSPSVVRAGISVIVGIFAFIIHRKQDTYTTISVAILYTLIQNPFSLFNIGLQLSYMGTLGIVLIYPIFENIIDNIKVKNEINIMTLEEKNISSLQKLDLNKTDKNQNLNNKKTKKALINKIQKYVVSSVLVTISANILIFPITLYNFNTVSLNFILSNVVASPILGICLILGMLILLVSLISINIARLLGPILNFFLSTLIKITDIIPRLFKGNITVITPYIITIISIYTIIFFTIALIKNREIVNKIIKSNTIKRLKHYIKNIIIILIIIVFISNIVIINIKKDLRIYFIDVGQGDSTLVCTTTGKNILIDGGGNRSPEKYDVGKKVLLPYLLNRRIKKLDYIIISHFDSDHCGGLLYVIQEIKVKNIIIGSQFEEYENYKKIEKIAKQKKINIKIVEAGQKINIEKELYFDILWPTSDKMISENAINNNSLVCKLNYKNFSMLFTGDIEELAEKAILEKYKSNKRNKKYESKNVLNATVLKVAHHGSKTSSTVDFLKTVSPKYVVIGVGKNNTFGHPSNITITNLKAMNVQIYRTDEMGEITITINKNRCNIKKFKSRLLDI